ncbi:thioredoxin family protein [Uliginosibacterium sp. H3]|uniref:Thioredoxin family protein n=1 Tax=Uliginosibacterium silvisoli TaxID=3114758 RepID=A0ABU6K3R1_9RHOO|nr:thioredoxin family protein [Uliginosibacterium sp. H3]
MQQTGQEFLVACLCAQWCGACREYRPAFEALATAFPDTRFAWVDVEDEPDVAGDIDIDNFPTLVIQRGASVVFCGPMLPHISQLERLLQTLMAQTPEESRALLASPQRQAWQSVGDVRSRLDERRS